MKTTLREQLFVALGAAMGSNCVPCIESILPKARAAGIDDAELQEALDLADSVRRRPARLVLQTAKQMLAGGEQVPVEDEEPCPFEAMAATGGEATAEAPDPAAANTSCCE